MSSTRWLLLVVMVLFVAVACGGNEEEFNLPETYAITKGGNLYEATAALCGTNAADEQGRGRWRRWRESDERIARAPMRNDRKLGAVITIPPGTYVVPRDLCADEGSWWERVFNFGFTLFLLAIVVSLFLWARLMRTTVDRRTPTDMHPGTRGRSKQS